MEDSISKSHWAYVNGGLTVCSNTPEQLWQNAVKYFSWCDLTPIIKKSTIKTGKGAGQKVEEEFPRPYSVKGLCLHCGILEEYMRDLRNSKDKTSLYYIVVSKILYIIHCQNLELATVGVFNPIFVGKVLNMDKDDTPANAIKVEIVQGLPSLSEDENQVLLKMENEKRQMDTGENDKIVN